MVMRNDVIGLIYFAHCSAGFIRVFSLSLRLKFLWFFFFNFRRRSSHTETEFRY